MWADSESQQRVVRNRKNPIHFFTHRLTKNLDNFCQKLLCKAHVAIHFFPQILETGSF